MKLTIDIPDEHAPAMLRFLASLMPAPVEETIDPAPGHPELPLAGIDSADPLKVAADDPVEPVKLADLVRPEVGKSYLTRHGKTIKIVGFLDDSLEGHINGNPRERMHYMPDGHTVIDDGIHADAWDLVSEAENEAPAPVEDTRPAIEPRAGRFYNLRNGICVRIDQVQGEYLRGAVRYGDEWLTYNWHSNGMSITDSGYDIVSECPF